MSCESISSSSCKECNDRASPTPTPYVSAPSSPRKCAENNGVDSAFRRPESTTPSDFDFSVLISEPGSPLLYPGACSTMSTAEELFHNGQIKPLNARFSSCTCYAYDLLALRGHTYDPSCPQCAACKGGSLSRTSVEHHGVPHTSRSHEQVKLTSSESAFGQWRTHAYAHAHPHPHPHPHAHAHAHPHPHVGRVTQIPSLPLASYGKSGHHHRRTRSLSPLRVFHMDDMMIQPGRPSFESELYTHMSSASKPEVLRRRRGRSRSRKSWTLKELLNLGDNKVHDKGRPVELGTKCGHELERKGNVGTNMQEKQADMESFEDEGSSASADGCIHYLPNIEGGIASCSPWNLQRAQDVLKRAEHEEVLHTDREPRKRTFLPDKKGGLLRCLGFPSKLSFVKGLHGMHFHAR